MILLAEEANRVKKGGQELIGGLDVRVNRNHFGRQVSIFLPRSLYHHRHIMTYLTKCLKVTLY